MEIERKFKLTAFPDHLPLLESSRIEQGYLSVRPTVRIRSRETDGVISYKLCIKGKGTLVREEVELALREMREEHLGEEEGLRNYLFDYLNESDAEELERVRLGNGKKSDRP